MKTPEDDQKNALTPPRMPDVTRLNRNVLLVAGMGVAVVVLAVTHVLRSDPGGVARQAGTARVEAGKVADFLRKPPEADRDTPIPPPAYPEPEQDVDSSTMQGGAAQPSIPSYGARAVSGPTSVASGSLYTRDPREEAYHRVVPIRACSSPGGKSRNFFLAVRRGRFILRYMSDKETARERKFVRSYAEAKKVDPGETVLVEVPGEYARQVVWLVNMLKDPDNSQAGQLVRQLLSTAKSPPK